MSLREMLVALGEFSRIAGASGSVAPRRWCFRSSARPSGSRAGVLRREPTLPSEPVRMATTRMEYDTARAREELGYTSAPAREGAHAGGAPVREQRFREGSQARAHPRRRQARARRSTSAADVTPSDVVRRTRESAPQAMERAHSTSRPLLEQRGSEAFVLHERHMNRQMPRVLRTPRLRFATTCAPRARTSSTGTARRYLDFLSGFGVFVLVRCHPAIEQALRDAMELELPTSCRWSASPSPASWPRRWWRGCRTIPYRCFFTNSGAESVETAIKFAARHRPRPRRVRRSRVSRVTTGALSLNGAREFRDRFGQLLPAAVSVPFGDLDALERELRAGDVAAYVVEPIQGKGVFVAPDGLPRRRVRALPSVRRAARRRRGADRSGRTGTFFVFEQWQSSPIWSRLQNRCRVARAGRRSHREELAWSRRYSTRWIAPSCTARPSGRMFSR